jgi:hypothetical protein
MCMADPTPRTWADRSGGAGGPTPLPAPAAAAALRGLDEPPFPLAGEREGEEAGGG